MLLNDGQTVAVVFTLQELQSCTPTGLWSTTGKPITSLHAMDCSSITRALAEVRVQLPARHEAWNVVVVFFHELIHIRLLFSSHNEAYIMLLLFFSRIET